jgi:hypothetical protein
MATVAPPAFTDAMKPLTPPRNATIRSTVAGILRGGGELWLEVALCVAPVERDFREI